MKLKIHRGDGVVEYNLVEIATETTKIILDCGRNLPLLDNNPIEEAINVTGLTSGASVYDAVIVTHHYADHGDFIERVNGDIPIFMNADTKIILDVVADFSDSPLPRVDKFLEHGRSEKIGDISVLPISVDRRVAGKMILLIEAGGKKLLYTSGYSYIDPAYYAMIGTVDAILGEVFHVGDTDDDVNNLCNSEEYTAELIRRSDKHVFVLCSVTDIDWIKHIERACRKSGRNMALDPFMKSILEKLTTPMIVDPFGFVPYIDVERTPRVDKHLICNRDMDFYGIDNFSSAENAARMTNLVFMLRPNMGGFLRRFNELYPLAGSTLISCMWGGYCSIELTEDFMDLCRSFGMEVIPLKPRDYSYRKQFEAAKEQLKPKTMISVQRIGMVASARHGKTIEIYDGDAEILI